MKIVPNTFSLSVGVLVTMFFGLIAYLIASSLTKSAIIAIIPETVSTWLPWIFWTKVLIGIIAVWAVIVYIGVGGFRKVPATNTAVLIILEHRFKSVQFGEGPHWVIPFISELKAFSTQVISLPFAEGDAYVEMISRDMITMRVRGLVQYSVVDPYLASGIGNITTTLHGYALARLRNAVSGEDALILPGIKQRISDIVHNGDPTDPSNIPDITESLEKDAAKIGLKIIKVNMSDMDPPKELMEATRRKVTERVEAEFKKVESDALADRINSFRDKLGRDEVSAEDATYAVEIQDGDKGTRRFVISGAKGSTGATPVVVINDNTNK